MFCEKCGNPLQSEDKFCITCGTKVETKSAESTVDASPVYAPAPVIEPKDKIPNGESGISTDDGVLCCPDCGQEVQDNEKYCIKCGSVISISSTDKIGKDEAVITRLQIELFDIFNANKVLSFFLKHGLFFVLAYPIYTLMARFEFLHGAYDFLSNFTIILYYAYNIGLLAAYANKRFKGIYIGLALRVLNSVILIFQGADFWPSSFRISIIIISAIFMYKKLMTDTQQQDLTKRFKSPSSTCKQCGASVNTSDPFCPKCGNRM